MEDPDLSVAARLVAVMLLVLANGFFVAAEFSLVTVRRTRAEQLAEEGHPLGPTLLRAVRNLDPFIAATQLGITMASITLLWIGEPAVASLLIPVLGLILPEDVAAVGAHSVAVVIAFLFITTLHIVLGELAPKSIALQRPESTALIVVRPVEAFLTVCKPFIWLLNTSGNLTLRLMGIRPAPGTHLVHSVEELKLMVIASRQAGLLSEREEDMIERLLDFSEVRAHHIMVPRTEMVCVSLDVSPDEFFTLVSTKGFDRYPVFQDDLDNIIGIVHARDVLRLMRAMGHRPLQPPVTEVMREPLVLPESLVVEDLLAELRSRRRHLAILVDEYGGTAGLVTLDDILRYVVGEMRDEFDVERPEIQAGPDGVYLVDGSLAIEDVNEQLGLNLDSEEFDTIGGLLLGELGRRPITGDQATVDGTVMRVDELDGLRISLVRITADSRHREM